VLESRCFIPRHSPKKERSANMLIKKPSDIAGSEITPKSIYQRRRDFMKGAGLLVGGSLLPGVSAAQSGDALKARAPAGLKTSPAAPWLQNKFTSIAPAPDVAPFYTDEALTPYDDVTRYNNFYEFGMDKSDPSSNSGEFKADPWSVEIAGEVGKPGVYTLEDILKPHDLEERIYRRRMTMSRATTISTNSAWTNPTLRPILANLKLTLGR